MLRLDDKNNFILDSTVITVNDQNLKDKFGLLNIAKVGDKSESFYVATEQSLRLTRASNEEHEVRRIRSSVHISDSDMNLMPRLVVI